MTQLGFDDICRGRHGNTRESVEANPAAARKAYTRNMILQAVAAAGEYGLTLDHMAVQMRVAPNQISGRFTELVVEGAIQKSGRRRPTRNGKSAAVYILSPPFF